MKLIFLIFLLMGLFPQFACTNSFNVVQDYKHNEEYDAPVIVDFDDFNYQSMERNIFLSKIRKTLN